MIKTEYQELPLPGDEKLITVNGKKYHGATANICTQCSAAQRFLFLKMRLSGGECVLECPVCDLVVTMKAEQVKTNLNNPG